MRKIMKLLSLLAIAVTLNVSAMEPAHAASTSVTALPNVQSAMFLASYIAQYPNTYVKQCAAQFSDTGHYKGCNVVKINLWSGDLMSSCTLPSYECSAAQCAECSCECP